MLDSFPVIPEPFRPENEHEIDFSPTETGLTPVIAVGSGGVVEKYISRAFRNGLINVVDIISFDDEYTFRQKNHEFDSVHYKHTSSNDETVEYLATIVPQEKKYTIANLATADARLPLTKKFLEDKRFDNALLFIEKPYGVSPAELAEFRNLNMRYPGRLHFSHKYAAGRGDILYRRLPIQAIPLGITARLIEGKPYYDIVHEAFLKKGSHPYLVDGPEHDIAFHLFTIIVWAADRFGGFDHFEINSTTDLSKLRKDFEPMYGFGAKIDLVTKDGHKIPIDIQVGKGTKKSARFLDFAYNYRDIEFSVRQYYNVRNVDDPVHIIADDRAKELTSGRHPKKHDYYPVEWGSDKLGHQTQEEIDKLLEISDFCFKLKDMRLNPKN